MFARTVKDYLMNPHRLSVFLEVARSGSVRGAADRLVVSQPAVTAAVRALEGDLRVSLVARQGRGIVLTSAGQVLAAYAARVLGLLEEARAAVEEAAEPGRGRARLAAVTTAGEHVLPPLIKEFRSRFPEVEIALEVGNRRLVWDRLRDREADLAVAGRPPPGLSGEPFLPNDLVLVGPADMSLPRDPGHGGGVHCRDGDLPPFPHPRIQRGHCRVGGPGARGHAHLLRCGPEGDGGRDDPHPGGPGPAAPAAVARGDQTGGTPSRSAASVPGVPPLRLEAGAGELEGDARYRARPAAGARIRARAERAASATCSGVNPSLARTSAPAPRPNRSRPITAPSFPTQLDHPNRAAASTASRAPTPGGRTA